MSRSLRSCAVSALPVRTGLGPPDAELVEAALRGERAALEMLFRRYARMTNTLACRLIGRDDSELDDVVQEAFARAVRDLPKLEEPAAFAGWLRKIVVRTAYAKIQRRKLMRRFGLLPRGEPMFDSLSFDRAASPEQMAEVRLIYRRAEALPTEARVALILRYFEGRELEEIADEMGISLATVKRRLRDAESELGLRDAKGARAGKEAK